MQALSGGLFRCLNSPEYQPVLESHLFSADHSAGVQLHLHRATRPRIPHRPGVPPASAGRGGLHPAPRLFSLIQPRPDAPAEPGQEGSGRQAAGHRPGGLHHLLHAVPHPTIASLPPLQGQGGEAR